MTLSIPFIVSFCFLVVISVIDFLTFNKKKGYIPAFLTTAFMIIMFLFGNGVTTIYIGILAGLIALFFSELELWAGISDVKTFIAGAMAFPTLQSMLVYATIVSIVAVGVKAFILFKVTKGKEWRFPFIPIILIAFIITYSLIFIGVFK